MTAPATVQSFSTVFKLDNAAAALTAMQGYMAGVQGLSRSKVTDGATFLSKRHDGHTGGVEEPGEISISGPYNATAFAHYYGIWNSTAQQTFEYDPSGTTTGLRKGTVESIMTGFELSWDLSATIQLSSSHKASGAWVFADN